MLQENKIINAVITLEVAIILWVCTVKYFGSISDFRDYVVSRIESIPRIGLIETGITRDEMLLRFGPSNLMEIYYDKKYKTVTKFYYRIDTDSNLFLMFLYSWQTGRIIDFDMVKECRDWHFVSYDRNGI